MNAQTHNATPNLSDLYFKTMTQAIRETMMMSMSYENFFFYVRRSTTTGKLSVSILGDYISDEPIVLTINKGEIRL